RALHAANQQAAKVQSDAHQRAKRGLRVGATYDQVAHGAEQREQELVAGYGEHRYAGVIVVSADSLAQLDQGTDEMISKGASHGLDLRALHGRHDVAVAATLPLARGLAPTHA
ncbi:MAG: hypothetical protein J2P16_17720, partial [Mycobacterium sp.]|nr:hypothetical protein [Mycobacterium sp.]